MSQIFILQNQHLQFLNRQLEWVDGRDAGSLYKTPHKDEALNQMFEVNAKDYSQRIKVLTCNLNDKGIPVIDADALPPLAHKFADAPAPESRPDTENATLAEEYEGNESLFAEEIVA